MPYKDIQKKALYQRNYMRKRRANLKLNSTLVRPKTLTKLDPKFDADGYRLYDE